MKEVQETKPKAIAKEKTGAEKKVAAAKKPVSSKYKRAPVRLWVKACFLGFRRARDNHKPGQALLKIEGVNEESAARYYFGKRVVYIFKGQKKIGKTRFRTIWGRIAKSHGNKGVVIARFSPNLPARAMGATLRVMLYPQRSQ